MKEGVLLVIVCRVFAGRFEGFWDFCLVVDLVSRQRCSGGGEVEALVKHVSGSDEGDGRMVPC